VFVYTDIVIFPFKINFPINLLPPL